MKIFFLISFLLLSQSVWCQKTDSLTVAKKNNATSKKEHSPRKAAILSASLPGLGQIYNKKFWKVPLVYAALGTCVGFFIYNRNEYIDARDAYRNKLDNNPDNDILMPVKYQPVAPEAVRRYRNEMRQYVDYSVLAFVLCWGLNIVDAAVDGHLKTFDVSENLTMQVNPYIQPALGNGGVQIVFNLGKNKKNTK
jgi:hypothetical protein